MAAILPEGDVITAHRKEYFLSCASKDALIEQKTLEEYWKRYRIIKIISRCF